MFAFFLNSVGINGVGTEAQALHNVEDSVESFIEDTLRYFSAIFMSDKNLISVECMRFIGTQS